MVSGFADVKGARLRYEVTGEGPAIVLIHGNMVDSRMWDDQVPAFSRYYKVIRYDVRGYGKSSIPPEPYSGYEDLSALLDFLGVERTHLIGLSMGASIGLDFTLAHPARVRALVVVPGGIGVKEWPTDLLDGFNAFVEMAKSGDLARANAMVLEFAPMVPSSKIPAVRKRLERMLADYSWVHFHGEDREIGLKPSAEEQITNLHAPLLIVHGKLDVSAFLEGGRWLQRNVPNAERVEIPEAGHMVNMEQPEEFNRAVLDFLGSHSD